MKFQLFPIVMLPVFAMISCAGSGSRGGSGVGAGGLIDLRSYESLSVEIELEVPKWNSPPNLEILIDGEAAGYYTRDFLVNRQIGGCLKRL